MKFNDIVEVILNNGIETQICTVNASIETIDDVHVRLIINSPLENREYFNLTPANKVNVTTGDIIAGEAAPEWVDYVLDTETHLKLFQAMQTLEAKSRLLGK